MVLGHSKNRGEAVYFHPDARPLRQACSVLWDYARIREWGILELPPPDLAPQAQVTLQYAYGHDPYAELRWEESIVERREVYESGGLGWWAPGDESQLCWGEFAFEEKHLGREKRKPPTISNLVRGLSIREAKAQEVKTRAHQIREEKVREGT